MQAHKASGAPAVIFLISMRSGLDARADALVHPAPQSQLCPIGPIDIGVAGVQRQPAGLAQIAPKLKLAHDPGLIAVDRIRRIVG